MKKLLVAISVLLTSGLLYASSFNTTQFTFYLKNNTSYPLTIGITNYSVTPFKLEKTVVPPKTQQSIAVGVGNLEKGVKWAANVSIYAQIGSQKTVSTVTVMHYRTGQYGNVRYSESGPLIYKGKVYSVQGNSKIIWEHPNVGFIIG